jgi:hypothetical protein
MTAMGTFPTNTDFLYASKLTNLTINGSGVMDGQGAAWWTAFNASSSVERPPAMIEVTDCTGVTVEGITVQNSPEFHIQFLGTSANVLASALSITAAWPSPNTDGIDLRGTNINIQDCYISDGDDVVQIGGSQTTSGVTVQGCTFGTGHGLSIGSITSGGVSNVMVNNCVFNGTQYGLRLKSDRTNGGTVSNITYSNITMTGILVNPVLFYSYYPTVPSSPATDTGSAITGTTPFWNNVTFENVTASEATTSTANSGIIWGLPEAPVTNVLFDACTIMGSAAKVFEVYNTQGVTFDCNCLINGKAPSNTAAVTTYNESEAGADDVAFPTCAIGGNTATETSTNTTTHTATNTPTQTPTNTNTHTPTDTATKTMTNSATNTATHTSTNTATNTATVTSSNTATRTSTDTATQTATNTATLTPAITSTFTNTATNTPMNTASSSATQTATNTATLTPAVSSTFTNTATNTASPTATHTATKTASSTATNSATSTATQTTTHTPTNTATVTSTDTKMNTPTATFTSTPTNSATSTFSPLPTLTRTDTPTITATYTPTLSPDIVISVPFPNPSSGSPITFNVQAPGEATVTMDVFTLAFRKIYSQTVQIDGSQNFQWDLKDFSGTPVANGVYYVRIHVSGNPSVTKILKVLILR